MKTNNKHKTRNKKSICSNCKQIIYLHPQITTLDFNTGYHEPTPLNKPYYPFKSSEYIKHICK